MVFSFAFIIKCLKWFAYGILLFAVLLGWIRLALRWLGSCNSFVCFWFIFIFMWWLCFGSTLEEVVFDVHSHCNWVWDSSMLGCGILFPNNISQSLRFNSLSPSCLCLANCSATMCTRVLWNVWERYINAYVIFLVLQSFCFPHSTSPPEH